MSIRNKLLAAFGGVVLLTAAVAMYGNWIVGRSGQMIVSLYDGPLMAVSHARGAQVSFAQAYRTAEHALLVQDMSSILNAPAFEKTVEQFRADMKVVGERLPKDTANGQVEAAISSADEWAKMVMTRIKPPAGGALQLPLVSTILAKGQDVADQVDLVVEAASAYGFTFRSDSESMAAAARTELSTMAIITVLFGMTLSFGIAYSFTRPIRQAMTISEAIAGGNFEVQISTKRRDE